MSLLDKIVAEAREERIAELTALLVKHNLTFRELSSRMSYGMIGHLYFGDDMLIIIFPECFYVQSKDFSITKDIEEIVELIQHAFKELSRDEKNKVTPVILNKI